MKKLLDFIIKHREFWAICVICPTSYFAVASPSQDITSIALTLIVVSIFLGFNDFNRRK